jgi:hypothetical protein
MVIVRFNFHVTRQESATPLATILILNVVATIMNKYDNEPN